MGTTTQVLALEKAGSPFQIRELQLPPLRPNDALIRVEAAALNHRDVWIQQGQYSRIEYPSVLGSDCCGVVEEVGLAANSHWVGKRIIVNPSLNWGANPRVQGNKYGILGMPSHGAFARHCIVPADRLSECPAHLDSIHAAATPLAGLTAYRALFRQGEIQQGMKVLITGIGGGVALAALQFAIAAQTEVWVTSGSEEKLEKARQLGASGGVSYRDKGWGAALGKQMGGFDLTIDGTGGNQTAELFEAASPGGCIVCYGATLGKPEQFPIQRLFWKQIRFIGSTMGNDEDFAAMVGAIAQHKIQPVVERCLPFERSAELFALMHQGKQFGKLVMTMGEGQ